MFQWLVSAALVTGATTGVFAQDSGPQALKNGVDARPWEAIGRLEINGEGFCTGALIAPDLVLTAAHCLFDKRTATRINHETVEFRAGWRNGRAAAYRDVRRAVVHPAYSYAEEISPARVRHDLALLELVRPIRNTTIQPFVTAERASDGARVGVVSYAHDRAETPSLQEFCRILGRDEGVVITSCAVDFGSSGAPIFEFFEGRAEIVSVVSAKAEMNGIDVSIGTALGAPLDLLHAELAAGKGVYQNTPRIAPRLRVGEGRATSSAKFIKQGI